MDTAHSSDVRQGVRIEILSVLWNLIEMALAIAAGLAAGSILLIAFGLDSLIELVSSGMLLWRLLVESRQGDVERVEQAERRASRVVAITLALLCLYVLVTAVYGLVMHSQPESSVLGIGISAAAVLVMPYLAFSKRRIAHSLGSEALHGDAANSITCAYMAGTVLAGLAAKALLGWWWAENAAALLFLVWLTLETKEAFEEAHFEQSES